MTLRTLCCIAAGLMLCVCSIAQSADLFSVTAQSTSGTPQTVSASGNNLPNLFTKLINNQGQFSTLSGKAVSANLNYAGLNKAVNITKNAANTSATVSIPSIGLNKTFTATSTTSLKDQIINYLKQNGANEYSQFLNVVNRSSLVGVTDGNPLAATAMLADHQYFTFGLQPAPFPVTSPTRLDSVSTPNIRFDFSGGVVDTGQGDGTFVRGAFDVGFRLADPVGLVFSTPFLYRNFQGSNTYEAGEEVALPIAFIPSRGAGTLSWTLTPSGTVGAAGSLELASGGTFAGGGITSSLSYQLNSFTFTLADHYSYFHGYPIAVGDYHFDTDLEQQVLKNGLKISKSFGSTLYLDAEATYTNFLDRASIRRYWTPGAGIGVRFGPHAGLRLGYQADLADGLTIHEGNVQLYFNY